MMRQRTRWTAAAALVATACCAGVASAQYTSNVAPASYSTPVRSYSRLSGTNNPALAFYGASRPQGYAQQRSPVTPLPAVQAVTTAPAAKPFSSVRSRSNISPYLALDIRESSTSYPSYHAFVLPQLEQQRFEQQQQRQNRRLQQQLRTATAVGASTPGINGGIPTTGHSTQFNNTGGFYPTAR